MSYFLTHTPKTPTEKHFAHIRKHWLILPERGIVWSVRLERELGTKHLSHGKPYWELIIVINHVQRKFLRSHLVWWAYYGRWPTMEIDHINRDSLEDVITNLRESTAYENMLNSWYGDRGRALSNAQTAT